MAAVNSTPFSDNTVQGLGDPGYVKQISTDGVYRVLILNGNGQIVGGATSSGNITGQTAAVGTNWVVLGNNPCFKCTISNQTGTSIDVRQGGSGAAFTIPTGTVFTFDGILNTNDLEIKRTDNSNTQVTVSIRWSL